jgi:hypothetical protein
VKTFYVPISAKIVARPSARATFKVVKVYESSTAKVKALTLEKAVPKALAVAKKRWPKRKGWYGHTAG